VQQNYGSAKREITALNAYNRKEEKPKTSNLNIHSRI